MRFKYQNKLTGFTYQCPPLAYEPTKKIAFRFIFGKAHQNDRNSFLPAAIINPSRKFKNEAEKCSGYALSFFDTEDNAKKRYSSLVSRRPNLRKSLGELLAKGIIDKEDGVVSEVSASGHFNLHEFADVNLSEKFEVISHL